MRKILYTLFAFLLVTSLSAQVSLTNSGTAVVTDFTGFTGAGFTPSPAAGELDSDNWATNGFSSGSSTYGGTFTSGDFAKGSLTAPGTITSGGIYAYDNAGDASLWIQATGSDFTPGDITLRIQNNTGSTLTSLDIAYDLRVFNDGGRANSFNFSYSTDDVSYTGVSALDYTSPEAADMTPMVVTTNQTTTISGLSIADGAFAYLRWSSDDVTGSGSRDEFGLDNISVSGTAGVVPPTATFGAMKDNCIYSNNNSWSNGVGDDFIAGKTNGGNTRRGLIKFDLSSIPTNATITDVKLKLELVKSANGSGARTVSVHTLTQDWGEGTSNAGVQSGQGAMATAGDATWADAFFNTTSWTTSGGDYTSTASASTSVDALGNYEWTGTSLVSDVQGWVTNSANNHGWIVIGDEGANKTTKHFGSKDAASASQRPVLEVFYTTPPVVVNPYPYSDIATVTTSDANGVADSLNQKFELRGVVTSPDYDGNAGYSFSLADPTGGINVFSFSDVMSYVVTEGDSIHVKGDIDQFNGLTELVPDSIFVISQNNTLPTPTVVTTLDETTEMELIRMNGMSLVTPSQWPASGSANVDITDGSNTFTLRIDGDVISGMMAPSGNFDVIGIGSQFDNSSPFTDDYQILPRSQADFILTPVTSTTLEFASAATTVAEDAGTVTVDVTITNPSTTTATTVDVSVGMASTATNGSDFTFTSPTTVTFPANSNMNQTVSVVITDDMMQESDETIVLELSNQTSGVDLGTDSVTTITITDNDATITNALILTGIYDVSQNSSPKGYEFYVVQNIPDLSIFGIGAANNGGGTDGQEYTFPAVSATAGDYIYVASDTANFSAFFGIYADFEESGQGTGINGDDAIELFESGQVIDRYGDINVDGSGTAWDYLDSWAYRNCSTGPDSTFVVGDWTVAPINIFDFQTSNATTPQPMPLETYLPTCPQNIIAVDDVIDVLFNTTASFNPLTNDNIPNTLTNAGISTNPTNGTLTLNIITQLMEYAPTNGFCGTDMAEYFICDAFGCDTATITFNIECPAPAYDIATVVTNDADGNPDSLGVACELQGIVYGVDFNTGGGYSFTLLDATDGINVFSFDDVPSGYQVVEGDEIRAVGVIGFFNGLTELLVDSIEFISAGNTLKTPTIVTTLDESTESDLIKLEAVTLVDPTQWDVSGNSFNVDIRGAGDTLTMRIDNDCDIAGQPAPTGWFNVTGIGGQFDNSSPYTEGYQILPRYQADIELISNTNNIASLEGQVRFFPNPTSGALTIVSKVDLTSVRISNILGQEMMTVNSPNATSSIDVSHLTRGVYTITFVTENTTWTEQFVKR